MNENLKFIIFVMIGILIIIVGAFVFLEEDVFYNGPENYVIFQNDTLIIFPDNINFTNATDANIENNSDSLIIMFSAEDYDASFFMFNNKTLFRELAQDAINNSNLKIVNYNSLKVYESKDNYACSIVGELNGYPFIYSTCSSSYDNALKGIDQFYNINPDIKNIVF